MTITPQQKQFFATFGYLVLPGLLKEEIGWITEEFEAVFRDRGVVHDGTKRSVIVPFIDQLLPGPGDNQQWLFACHPRFPSHRFARRLGGPQGA